MGKYPDLCQYIKSSKFQVSGFKFKKIAYSFSILMIKEKLQVYLVKGRIEAGCDEAGRGCLAGPVFASAVILPPDFENDLLNDSKKLSDKQRYALRPVIEEQAIAFAVGIVDLDNEGQGAEKRFYGEIQKPKFVKLSTLPVPDHLVGGFELGLLIPVCLEHFFPSQTQELWLSGSCVPQSYGC